MTLKELQEEVDKWAQQFETPYWPPLEQMANLSEEVGEVARVLNRMYGHKQAKTEEEIRQLSDELVHALFPIICIANGQHIDLQTAWERMIQERLYQRDKDRYQKK